MDARAVDRLRAVAEDVDEVVGAVEESEETEESEGRGARWQRVAAVTEEVATSPWRALPDVLRTLRIDWRDIEADQGERKRWVGEMGGEGGREVGKETKEN